MDELDSWLNSISTSAHANQVDNPASNETSMNYPADPNLTENETSTSYHTNPNPITSPSGAEPNYPENTDTTYESEFSDLDAFDLALPGESSLPPIDSFLAVIESRESYESDETPMPWSAVRENGNMDPALLAALKAIPDWSPSDDDILPNSARHAKHAPFKKRNKRENI